jgi:hypothetical protein
LAHHTTFLGLLLKCGECLRAFDDGLQEVLHADDDGLGFALFGNHKALAVSRDPIHDLPQLGAGDKGGNAFGHKWNVLLWHDTPSETSERRN